LLYQDEMKFIRKTIDQDREYLLLLALLALRPHMRWRLNCTWKTGLVGLTGSRRMVSTAQTSAWRPPCVFWARHSLLSLCRAWGATGITTYRGSFIQ